jgi:hypothetical protein
MRIHSIYVCHLFVCETICRVWLNANCIWKGKAYVLNVQELLSKGEHVVNNLLIEVFKVMENQVELNRMTAKIYAGPEVKPAPKRVTVACKPVKTVTANNLLTEITSFPISAVANPNLLNLYLGFTVEDLTKIGETLKSVFKTPVPNAESDSSSSSSSNSSSSGSDDVKPDAKSKPKRKTDNAADASFEDSKKPKKKKARKTRVKVDSSLLVTRKTKHQKQTEQSQMQ